MEDQPWSSPEYQQAYVLTLRHRGDAQLAVLDDQGRVCVNVDGSYCGHGELQTHSYDRDGEYVGLSLRPFMGGASLFTLKKADGGIGAESLLALSTDPVPVLSVGSNYGDTAWRSDTGKGEKWGDKLTRMAQRDKPTGDGTIEAVGRDAHHHTVYIPPCPTRSAATDATGDVTATVVPREDDDQAGDGEPCPTMATATDTHDDGQRTTRHKNARLRVREALLTQPTDEVERLATALETNAGELLACAGKGGGGMSGTTHTKPTLADTGGNRDSHKADVIGRIVLELPTYPVDFLSRMADRLATGCVGSDGREEAIWQLRRTPTAILIQYLPVFGRFADPPGSERHRPSGA